MSSSTALFEAIATTTTTSPSSSSSPSSCCTSSTSKSSLPLSSDDPAHHNLTTRLDALLELYLDRLEAYQILRGQISKDVSNGFLSLAHANRTSSLGSGRRYGEDGYDERMKAERRVRISVRAGLTTSESQEEDVRHPRLPKSPAISENVRVYTVELYNPIEAVLNDTTTTGPPTTTAAAVTQDTCTGPSSPGASPKRTTTLPIHQAKSKLKSNKAPNPLNWYGVLVPPPLRAAQTSFISVVEGSIPQLLRVQAELEELEEQIRQARKETGSSQAGHENAHPSDTTAQVPVTQDAEEERHHDLSATTSQSSSEPSHEPNAVSPDDVNKNDLEQTPVLLFEQKEIHI